MYVISIKLFLKEGGVDYRDIHVLASNLALAEAFVAEQFKGDHFDFFDHRQSIQTHVVVLDDDTTGIEFHTV